MTVKLGFAVIWICKYTWSQQDQLKVHGENHDVIVSFGLLFIILLFLSWLFFSLFMFPEVLFRHSAIFMSKTHSALIFFGLYMAMICIFISLSKTCLDTRSFLLESQYPWNTLHRCVHEVITVSRYSFSESFQQYCEGSLVIDSRHSLAIRTFSLLPAPVFLCCFLDEGLVCMPWTLTDFNTQSRAARHMKISDSQVWSSQTSSSFTGAEVNGNIFL